MDTHTYMGIKIRRCGWEVGQHSGRWIIQSYHETGIPWSDECCKHVRSLAEAREYIREYWQHAAIHRERSHA